jgi:CrcB protein
MGLASNRRLTADGSYGGKELIVPVMLAIALGGSFGAVGRYAVTRLVENRVVAVFPWDTFVVNVTGCFAAGLLVSALVDRHTTPEWLRLGLVFGFLGSYTTFSAFAQDLYDLHLARDYAEAVANALASIGVAVAAVAAGTLVGRLL